MLTFFTDPYPNELLYSTFARYNFYSGNIDLKDTLTELFGKNSVISSFEIGSHLGFLCNELGGSYTPERLLQEHTLFPFYAPFLPGNRKRELLKDIKFSDGKGIYTKIGIVAGSICKKDSIYYCPSGAREEMEILGEAYIHREHQIQGVLVCPHHGVILRKYPIKRHEKSRVEYLRLDGSLLNLSDKNEHHVKYKDELLKISKAAYYLLNNDLSHISKEDVLYRYKNLLYEKGLATNSFRVKQDELHNLVVSNYGTELLELLESNIDKNDEYNWLKVATRNVARTVHPLRHILLILSLTVNIETFFKGIREVYNPFGNGPWPCLNKASDHYLRDVVTHLTITSDYKTREPVGSFECECKYIYSRKGPDKTESDRYRKGRVKEFGTVWEDKLKKLLSEQCHSYRKIADKLGCDIKTIHKYKAILTGRDSIYSCADSMDRNSCKEEYRDRLLHTLNAHPELSRTEIRNLCQKEYTFLYRHDREWLFEALPKGNLQCGSKGHIDWDKRDHEVLWQLHKAHSDLMNRVKPIRISKTSLGKAVNKLSLLEKHLHKLPCCEKFIHKVSETKQQFQIRRSQIILQRMKEEDLPLIVWKIQREAGLRKVDYELIKDKLLLY